METKIIILCSAILALASLLVFLQKAEERDNCETFVQAVDATSSALELETDKGASARTNSAPEIMNVDKDATNEKPLFVIKAIKSHSNLRRIQLSSTKLAQIKEAIKTGPIVVRPRSEQKPIATVKDAISFLNISVSMAYTPKDYFEDEDFFYFSGGTTANRVEDFSTGFAVSKVDKSITSW